MSKTKLVCISAETGEMKWGQRGFGKGSLIISGKKLIVLSDQGLVSLVEASPEKFTKIGSFQVLKGKSWTAPTFADGKLFVRNLSKMSCYKLSN
jgi:outer membrane protein assembly factor BamB